MSVEEAHLVLSGIQADDVDAARRQPHQEQGGPHPVERDAVCLDGALDAGTERFLNVDEDLEEVHQRRLALVPGERDEDLGGSPTLLDHQLLHDRVADVDATSREQHEGPIRREPLLFALPCFELVEQSSQRLTSPVCLRPAQRPARSDGPCCARRPSPERQREWAAAAGPPDD